MGPYVKRMSVGQVAEWEMASSILVRLLNLASLDDDDTKAPVLTIQLDQNLLGDLLEWGAANEDVGSEEVGDDLESRRQYHRKLFFLLTALKTERGDSDVEQFLDYKF